MEGMPGNPTGVTSGASVLGGWGVKRTQNRKTQNAPMTQSHCQDPERTRKHDPESTTQKDGGGRSRSGGELQSRRRGVREFKRVKSPDPEISDRFQTAQRQTAQLWSRGSDSSVVVAGLVGSAQFACQDADDPVAIRFLFNCISMAKKLNEHGPTYEASQS